ncbi:hypothetical protein KVR01_009765 [Diaporthe batatas]|uniref:uncharacterized protein n=1 Tax=Diaporthe batatas TaxID=748121 RepID=UPI001D0561D8|nr:uncharacterized protein KVR01_009765 [Diaporthe batatas]KAG8160229.1 hypothetical protein KVR01_009765 [Diaporthe batatas]
MPVHGGNITPSPSSKDDGINKGGTKDGSPKTPTNVKSDKKKLAQIELTPTESLLFFNMPLTSLPLSASVDWAAVAVHSNLKNAASAKILKKHGLMDHAPETPRSQAQKRKAAMKSQESVDDDEEDVDSSYNPGPGIANADGRKRSTVRAASSRAKRTKGRLRSEQDQDDKDVAVNSVGAAPSPASKLHSKSEIKFEGKTGSEPGSDSGVALLNDDGIADAIDGATSASPYEPSHGQEPSPQALGTGAAYLSDLGYHQSGLLAHMDDPQATELLHPGMVPIAADGLFGFEQRLSPGQVADLQASHDSQVQRSQLSRLQAPQMLRYQTTSVMPGDNLPFGYLGPTQFNQHFPIGAYNGVPFFDQPQLSHGVGYGYLDEESLQGGLDGQHEWMVDDVKIKREGTPESEGPAEAKWQPECGDEVKQDGEPSLEEIRGATYH